MVWYAVPEGMTDVARISLNSLASITVTFKMFTPYGFSETPKTTPLSGGKFQINNLGTALGLPKFTFDIGSDCGYISLVSPRGNILLGKRDEVDVVSLPKSQQLFVGSTNTLSGWTVNDGTLPISGAYFGGTMGTASGLTPLSYGSYANAWHGATIKKTLTPATNWDVKAEVSFKVADNSYTDEKGRLDFMLLDEVGGIIGRISLIDSSSGYAYTVPEFWFGDKRVWSETAKTPSAKSVRKFNSSNKKWETKTIKATDMGEWNDFDGVFSIRYMDNKLTFQIEKRPGKTETYTVQNANRLIGSKKLASVCVWFAQYGAETPTNSMKLRSLNVKKHNVSRIVDVPNLLQAGDKVEIDSEFSTIRLNGKMFLDAMDIGSDFFELEEGITDVKVFSSKGASITGSSVFTERFI
jgi:hypothetical protein